MNYQDNGEDQAFSEYYWWYKSKGYNDDDALLLARLQMRREEGLKA